MSERPLVVDLDGTLAQTDTLLEAFLRLLKQAPWMVLWLPLWLLRGKAHLKAQLAARVMPDMAVLPLNEEVVRFVRAAREAGRTVVLATASPMAYARALNEAHGLFDEVLATEGERNLKATRKAEVLVARFGEQGFDYIGNDAADLPVWSVCHTVHVASPSARFARRAWQRGSEAGRHFPAPGFRWGALVKAVRLHQWLKNLLVFVPLLASHQFTHSALVLQAGLAFLAFGLCASSVYLLNDMLDLDDDRHHRSKRFRPFAAGTLPLPAGFLAVPVFLMLSLGLAVILPWPFWGVLALYFLTTLAYSFSLKRLLFVDVVVLAGLYTLRIIGGAAAVSVAPSFWLLSFSVFIFLSLAIVKRYTELHLLQAADQCGAIKGRGYRVEDMGILLPMGIASGYLAVLVMALYLNSDSVLALYQRPEMLWLSCLILLYWISRVWVVTYRGEMHDDPIVFALKDRVSRYTAVLMVIVFGMAA